MKLSSRQDIEAPAARVFDLMADFATWERAALRRGAEITRLDTLDTPAPGMEWRIRFHWRGRPREATVRLTRYEMPGRLAFAFGSSLYEGTTTIDIFEMAARRSRIHVVGEAKPRTLAARLVLQSLRLARSKVERRFDNRIALIAAEIESRLTAPGPGPRV